MEYKITICNLDNDTEITEYFTANTNDYAWGYVNSALNAFATKVTTNYKFRYDKV